MTFDIRLTARLNQTQDVYTIIQIDASSPEEAAYTAMKEMEEFDNGQSPGLDWQWWDSDDEPVEFDNDSALEISKQIRVRQTTETIINLPQ